MGLDAAAPRFSWKTESDAQGVMQTGYHIIARSDDVILWDSGVVESAESQQVRYAGLPLASRQAITWQVRVTAVDDTGQTLESEWAEAGFEMGLLRRSDWYAQWIEPEGTVDPDTRKPAPYLRREFVVRPGLKKARIYQTAHGLYEFWINGKMATGDKFKPGLTSYYYRIQYQVYDVTPLLNEGLNCWAVALGDGWWRGVTGGSVKNNFGRKLHYFGQIELTYQDGTVETVCTDTAFKTSYGGLLASDMQMGDQYDARLEPQGWKLPEFDDSSWKPVHFTAEHTDAQLIASRSVPVHEKEVFTAKEFQDAAGRRVLDFGQNIAGYVRMRLRNCKPGQEIHLVHGEDIDATGCFSVANINQPVLKVPQFQEVTYICGGRPLEEYCPMFSVFGFRYVLLEGYAGEIQPDDFTAIAVYSDMEETGWFTCSDPLINKLVENSRWSQKGNFLDVAMDCPTRERNAWTGDNQVYVRTAAYFMDVYSFYEKWLQDQTIEQYASGKVGITFPSTSSVHDPAALENAQKTNPTFALAGPDGDGNIGEDCAGWGDAAVWLPYSIYLAYGDQQILKNQYGTAKKWVDYMLRCAKEHNPLYEDQPQYHSTTEGELDADYIYDTRMHYGEWQEPIEKPTADGSIADAFLRMIREGKPKVATAYMCRSADNVAHMAGILGFKEDAVQYQRLADHIRFVYDKYLIGQDGTIEPGHQAAYVRALAMDLCSAEKRPLVEEQLVKEIEAAGYRLNTGFLSTPFLLPVLTDMGRGDLAYRILEQTEYPSWLHPITLGATTIPESWNSFDVHDASYNHYSYGAVCEFLFAYIAGIRPTFDGRGYKKFILKPIPGGNLTHAEATYESPYGTIVSGWKILSDTFCYHCTVPANTEAVLTLPNGEAHRLKSGSYQFKVLPCF